MAAGAGAPLPEDVIIDGHNLMPLADGTGEIDRENDAIFWNAGHYKVVRAGDWKLQVNDRIDYDWLFNLAEDPTEQVNLADARPDKLAELKAILDAHHADRVPPLYVSASESPIMIDKTLAERFEDGDEYIYWPN